MRKLTLIGLIAVSGAAAIAAILVGSGRGAVSDIARGEKLFPGLAERLDTVNRIEVARHDGRFVLEKRGDTWVLPDKGGYPARADLVRQTLIAVAQLETVEAKTAKADLLSRLNLADVTAPESKAAELVLKNSAGASLASVVIGKKRSGSASALTTGTEMPMVYVRRGGETQSWLAMGDIDPRATAQDWAIRDLVDLPEGEIARVEITPPGLDGATPVPYTLVRPEDDKAFTLDPAQVPQGQKPKEGWEINAVAAGLETLTLEDVTRADALTGTSPLAEAVFHAKSGLRVSVTLVTRDKEIWATIAATGEGDAAAQAKTLNDRLSGWAYRLPEYKTNRMKMRLTELLDPIEQPKS